LEVLDRVGLIYSDCATAPGADNANYAGTLVRWYAGTQILVQYFGHMKDNPNTLLCRFFGLHRIKPGAPIPKERSSF
jgi:hypothetical protein